MKQSRNITHHILSALYCALLLISIIALAACASAAPQSAIAPSSATFQFDTLVATVQPQPTSDAARPAVPTQDPLVATTQALLVTITPTDDDCSSIQALIWPDTWTVTVADDRVTMQAPNDSQITLAHGDRVAFVGGEVQGPASVPGAAARVSPDCTGSFWLLSGLPERVAP